MRVKICGITTREDALDAAELGASFLGFNFYSKSPRYISPENAAEIIRDLPDHITTVGVFVNATKNTILEIKKMTNIKIAQLHGDESIEFCRSIPMPIIKAIRSKNEIDLFHIKKISELFTILVDASVEDQYGGTGQCANWLFAQRLSEKMPMILAGGLKAENVMDAISKVHPIAVDICSGVEDSPGKKSRQKMQIFFDTLKRSLL